MNSRFQAKSDLYVFFGYLILAAGLAVNPLSLMFGQKLSWIPPIQDNYMHLNDILIGLPGFGAALLLLLGGMMVWAPRYLNFYLNNKLWFNLLVYALLVGVLFSSNPIRPGSLRLLRIGLVLALLFVQTNALYLGVVKDAERRHVHPFYRNLGLSLYTLLTMFFVLEIVFMFVLGTHRFNGTLGSRAWFLRHWALNAEGYRDAPIDPADKDKKHVLVLGDSFVAGHGVKDAKDRFSDRLDALLPQDYVVHNLGVGGSDVLDAYERLRAYPVRPDYLIFSYYPNDIEEDGQRGGLLLQHARSYEDVAGFFRYFIRRSYVLNHLYWRFPHPSELTDYKGYVRQCYGYVRVMLYHRQHLDQIVDYADSLQIPMAAVVFPFLEDAKGSDFATQPILQHFHNRHVPTLDVRQWLLGKDPMDYIVNANDPHPNERLHGMVADSLFARLPWW